ncbi:hypothetical protein WYI_18722 [Ochrobactrum sp. CDB2]|nr:hypothetical protein WYI_18722 [Ochrobactrum sp. CDB2]
MLALDKAKVFLSSEPANRFFGQCATMEQRSTNNRRRKDGKEEQERYGKKKNTGKKFNNGNKAEFRKRFGNQEKLNS